jgi:NTP pyrophosphatase (non-canonical NTP hydrolase)
MLFDDYQRQTSATAIYPGKGELSGFSYCGLKLAGEAGEVAEKIGKAIRDDGGVITPARNQALQAELGDVLWYLAQLAEQLGTTLGTVAQANLDKLNSRKQRGVLGGSGDNR